MFRCVNEGNLLGISETSFTDKADPNQFMAI